MSKNISKPLLTQTWPVGAGGVTKNTYVKLSGGKVVTCGNGERAAGIAMETALVNEDAVIMHLGIFPVKCGSGAVAEGEPVQVAALGLVEGMDAAAQATAQEFAGYAFEARVATSELISVFFPGPWYVGNPAP